MGVMAGLTLLASFIQLLSDFGLNHSLAKFVSELKGRGEGSSSHLLSDMVFQGCSSILLVPSTISLSRRVLLASF